MLTLARKFLYEPAMAVAVIVAVVTAGIAVAATVAAGAPAVVVVGAALSSILTTLVGGKVTRDAVVPVQKVERTAERASLD